MSQNTQENTCVRMSFKYSSRPQTSFFTCRSGHKIIMQTLTWLLLRFESCNVREFLNLRCTCFWINHQKTQKQFNIRSVILIKWFLANVFFFWHRYTVKIYYHINKSDMCQCISSDSRVAEKFCQLKIFPGLVEKILPFIWLVF